MNIEDDIDDNFTEEEKLGFLLFFKTCVLPRDYDILKIKMDQTIKLRESVVKESKTVFYNAFPFYFICPELVSKFVFRE